MCILKLRFAESTAFSKNPIMQADFVKNKYSAFFADSNNNTCGLYFLYFYIYTFLAYIFRLNFLQ